MKTQNKPYRVFAESLQVGKIQEVSADTSFEVFYINDNK
ncbi:hypothetical protein QE390_004956 [Siphonobacter sp. SORGH_AS 1065]|nr:hypothetical protein [Siphonobacter sp. SORGH_AS_1065]